MVWTVLSGKERGETAVFAGYPNCVIFRHVIPKGGRVWQNFIQTVPNN